MSALFHLVLTIATQTCYEYMRMPYLVENCMDYGIVTRFILHLKSIAAM